MINEIVSIIYFVACIGFFIVRLGLFRRLLLAFLGQRILGEISRLKVSAPNLKSTFNRGSFTSP